jgi:hypothetical protein
MKHPGCFRAWLTSRLLWEIVELTPLTGLAAATGPEDGKARGVVLAHTGGGQHDSADHVGAAAGPAPARHPHRPAGPSPSHVHGGIAASVCALPPAEGGRGYGGRVVDPARDGSRG